METISKKTLHSIGRIKVQVKRMLDEYADVSHLGEFSNYKEPRNKEQKLVHRDSGSVLDHTGIWRDGKGRIVSTPEEYRYSREYQYTFHDNGHDKIKYALEDSRRLERFNEGDLYCIGILAEVFLNKVKIAEDSVWGFESDSEEKYLRMEEKSIARQAMESAREWIDSSLSSFAA